MKKNNVLLFLSSLILSAIGLSAAKLAAAPSQYRSAWVTVLAGQVVLFPHPLNREPDTITVWTKLDPSPSLDNIRPWTELPGLILVNSVDDGFVIIQNADETDWQISIFVR